MAELKPCPFCGSTDIRYSIKIALHRRNKQQHRISMYCWKCNCYGARTVIDTSGRNRHEVEHDTNLERIAAETWNRRVNNE